MSPELLSRLLDRHAAALELFAAQWTRAPADVVQEAFVRLFQQSPPPEHVVPWLYRVVRNAAIDAARAEGRRRTHESAAASRSDPLFVEVSEAALDAHEATSAVQELPQEEREAIVAHVWGGLTFEEVGEALGVSSSTAHRRYQAGLKSLRERLGVTWLAGNGPQVR